MAKRIIVHRHSDKTPDGKHISNIGRKLCKKWGKLYDRLFGADSINHVFFGKLIRTTQTAYATITGRFAFDEAIIHDEIDGFGSNEMFGVMITDEVRRLIKEDGLSNLEAVIAGHSEEVLLGFITEGKQALTEMFDQMADGELGVGFFHDPTIPLVAKDLGLENARSLDSMEPIVFTQTACATITANWPTCFEK